MKFRDPKTGEVFESIYEIMNQFCARNKVCADCTLPSACTLFVSNEPAKAARLMGYEVVEDDRDGDSRNGKEDQMEKMDKPRICEVLGVEVNEEWRVSGNDMATYRITEDDQFEYAMPLYQRPGHGKWHDGDIAHLIDFINHPDRIIRKPRFTEEEVGDAKAVVRVFGRDEVFQRQKDGRLTYGNLYINKEFLPSLRPGQSVKLEDIIGEST